MGKLCFTVSFGAADETGKVLPVKGLRVEISVRKYDPALDGWEGAKKPA